jgi:hypothetical protein
MVTLLQTRDLFFGHVAVAKDELIHTIQRLYTNPDSRFGTDNSEFMEWHNLTLNPDSPLQFVKEPLNPEKEYLVYDVSSGEAADYIEMVAVPPANGQPGRRPLPSLVTTSDAWHALVEQTEAAARVAATSVVEELNERFPDSKLLTALSIVQIDFWNDDALVKTLSEQLAVLRTYYGTPKTFMRKDLLPLDAPPDTPEPPPVSCTVPATLDVRKLEYQRSEFVAIMQQRAK